SIVPGSSTRHFCIGDASSYTPVDVLFTGITQSGTLTATTTPGDHPAISKSLLSDGKTVNRFWTLSNESTLFTSYDAIFTFSPNDIDPSVNTDFLVVEKWNGTAWSNTNTGTKTATTLNVTGLTSFSDFQAGEECVTPVATFSYIGSPYCNSGSNPVPTFSAGGVTGTFSSTPVGLVFVSSSTGEIINAASKPGTYTVTNTIAASGGCPEVSANSSVTLLGPTITSANNRNWECKSSTVTYTTESGKSNYLWKASFATILSGQGTNSVSIKFIAAGNFGISVTYDYESCTGMTSTFPISIYPATPTVTTIGGTSLCAGKSATYNTNSGFTKYAWTPSSGGSITSGQGTPTVNVTWDQGVGSQTLKVIFDLPEGACTITPTTLNVCVNPLPTPTFLNSPSHSATLNSTVTYTTESGNKNYLWTVSSGGSIQSGGSTSTNTITIQWTGGGSQWVAVNYTNSKNCTAPQPTTFDVTVGVSKPMIIPIDPNSNQDQVTIFPVPSSGKINLNFNFSVVGNIKLRIFNDIGKERFQCDLTSFNDVTSLIDLSFLPDGLYLALIESNKKTFIKKLIISK
ncbi:MAG: T9SS type A sorting domain-containing protein, partial [Bacteroidota bacterium]